MHRKQHRSERQRCRLAPAVIQQAFTSAVQNHQAGRLNEAIRLYGDVLKASPRHADSLHLLGVAASQMGRHDLAADLISQAITINDTVAAYHASLGNALAGQQNLDDAAQCYRTVIGIEPDNLEAHNNLGNALKQQGRLDEAAACFHTAIGLNPGLPALHFNLGNTLLERGLLEEAVACYRRTLDLKADYPEAFNNLGNALGDQGRLDEAIVSYRSAIDFKPDYLEAHYNLGAALAKCGRLDEAIASCRRALILKPDYPDGHNNLGVVLMQFGRLDEAAACFRTALDLKPIYPNAQYNLGNALMAQGQVDEAVVCYRRALDLKPDYPEAHNNLGNALREQRQLDAAIASYRAALQVRPDYAEACNNLGTSLMEQGRLDEAAASYRNAILHKPDYPDPHANLATVLLAQGDMAAGWREYEWRWKMPQMIPGRRCFAQPQWRGEAAEGRTLLIHAEQGFGDTLQFCRYATRAAAAGLRVIIEAPKPLVRLLRSLSGVDLVMQYGADLPAFDFHCPMLSLPLALGTTVATIPGATPYLCADAARAAFWRARLSAIAGDGPRIGLVWAGNPGVCLPAKAAMDRRRSLSLEQMAPLVEIPGMHFFNLQKDGPASPGRFPLVDVMGEMGDFADTAALIVNLDLVISVDTAVAHLAGALGKPVWLLNRFDTCWRWLTGRRDSPWYPTLRLYRQPRPGDWGAVLAEVARDLRDREWA